MLECGGRLPRYLDQLDILLEHVIDQFGEVHALGVGLGGQVALHLLIEIHRQTEDRLGPVELAAHALAEIVKGNRIFPSVVIQISPPGCG